MQRIAFFFLVLCWLLPIQSYAETYNKIVFFGDSLSDNGNIYKVDLGVLPKSPPYFKGRFSNGPVWAENIADYFRSQNKNVIVENDAVGGETIVWHNPFDGFLPYVLSESIDKYLFWYGSEDKSHVLYFMWVGGNDYLEGASDVDQVTTNIVQSQIDSIERLIISGGKNFIILNLPDLSRVPYGHDRGKAANIYTLTIMHNSKLANSLIQLQQKYPHVNIRLYDIFQLLNSVQNETDRMNKQFHTHLTNTSHACWPGGYTIQKNYAPDLLVAYEVGQKDIFPCPNPEEYAFWDSVHPTTVLHKILSDALIQSLKN